MGIVTLGFRALGCPGVSLLMRLDWRAARYGSSIRAKQPLPGGVSANA
jgi:hypothetical protein